MHSCQQHAMDIDWEMNNRHNHMITDILVQLDHLQSEVIKIHNDISIIKKQLQYVLSCESSLIQLHTDNMMIDDDVTNIPDNFRFRL